MHVIYVLILIRHNMKKTAAYYIAIFILACLASCDIGDPIFNPSGIYYTDFMRLTNCYGNQENVHPKVLFFPDSLFGHRYWMAYTPYPCGEPKYENPCVAYSDDGINWNNATRNPLDVPKDQNLKYNSDTHLVYNEQTKRLEVWFRYADEEKQKEIIYRMQSEDGFKWQPKEEMHVNDTTNNCALFLCPTVIHEDNEYHIWTVNLQKKEVEFYTSQHGDNWQYKHSIKLEYNDEGIAYYPWHMDIIHDEGKYIMCMMVKGYNTTSSWCLFYTESEDNVKWTTPVIMLKPRKTYWDAYLYRSSLVKTDEGYSLYYSAKDNRHFGLGLLKADQPNGFLERKGLTENTD